MAVNRSNDRSIGVWIYFVIALLIILVGVGAFLGYGEYNDLKQENQRLSNPEEAAKTEIENTKSAVSQLIEVPTDEEPTIANVVDVTKLEDQAFFANAQNGDKLLVYQNAKKAILYRPSTNKIIEVSTIDIGQNSSIEQGTEAEQDAPQATEETDESSTPANRDQPGLE